MQYNPYSLTGKTILVTGASSGIGRATAIECSRLGARIVLSARNIDRLNETMSVLEGDGHLSIPAEITNDEQLASLVAECPSLDGAAFCAGVANTTLFNFADKEKYQTVFDTNFFSPTELFRQLVKKKKLGKGSSVVFVVSIGGPRATTPGNGIYGASKSALETMIHFAALELAPKNIRVNGVLPGMVETPIMQGGGISDEEYDLERQRYPLKRFGKPEEIAWAMAYFLSDASNYVTGSSLVMDGGAMLKFG